MMPFLRVPLTRAELLETVGAGPSTTPLRVDSPQKGRPSLPST